MNNPIMTRIDDDLFNKLENYANEKHWKVSQAVREIIIKFFNYELSDNAG